MLLEHVYDGFAETYHQNRGVFDVGAVLEDFYARLPAAPGHLLDLGCGAGEPVGRFFLDRDWAVTGADFSEKMLALAGRYAPGMKTVRGDMRTLEFPAAAFDAVAAFYSLFHLPTRDHADLFARMFGWLKPGGKCVFTYATQAYTGAPEFDGTKEFMGNALYYGHKTPEALHQDLVEAGFSVEDASYREIGGETFLWVTAGKSP